jgi:predicted nucleotidyltransferase
MTFQYILRISYKIIAILVGLKKYIIVEAKKGKNYIYIYIYIYIQRGRERAKKLK